MAIHERDDRFVALSFRATSVSGRERVSEEKKQLPEEQGGN